MPLYYNGTRVWGSEAPDPTPTPTPDPVIDPELLRVRCSLTFDSTTGIADRWVPNTDEWSRPFGIEIYGQIAGGARKNIPENTNIMIPCAADPNYGTDEGGTNNVKRNKGKGFRLKGAGRPDSEWLVQFNTSTLDGMDGFSIAVNSNYFTGMGSTRAIPQDGNSLRVDALGRLRFVYNDTGLEVTSFVMKAMTVARPGDDILLQFGLTDFPNQEISSSPGDFLACYDKKLLWRAQSYIDERKNVDSTWKVADAGIGADRANTSWSELTQAERDALDLLDWNGKNRWTYAQGNNWDKDWEDADMDGNKDEAGPYNGGQCEIKPWTSIYTFFDIGLGPHTVYNAVAYSYGCDDTPYFFNQDLVDLKNAGKAYYNLANNIQVAPNHAPGEHRDWLNWENTLAPGDEWGNYIHANPAAITTNYNIAAVNGTVYYPYAPGFSSFRILNGDNPDYYFDHTQYSAGTECQGLVTRAAGYKDDIYDVDSPKDDNMTLWTHKTGQGMILPENWTAVGWVITSLNTSQTSLVIPGDVIIMNKHMGMVYQVTYNSQRIATREDVKIIDSSGISMCVRNIQNWNYFVNYVTDNYANPFCNILRLSVK